MNVNKPSNNSSDSTPTSSEWDSLEEYRSARHLRKDALEETDSEGNNKSHLRENPPSAEKGATSVNNIAGLVKEANGDTNQAVEKLIGAIEPLTAQRILAAQDLSEKDQLAYFDNGQLKLERVIKNFVVMPIETAKTPEGEREVLESLRKAMLTPAPNETASPVDAAPASSDGQPAQSSDVDTTPRDSAASNPEKSADSTTTPPEVVKELTAKIKALVPPSRQEVAKAAILQSDKAERVSAALEVMEALGDGQRNLADIRDHPTIAELDQVLSNAGLTPIATQEEFANYPLEKLKLLVDLLNISPQGQMVFEKIVPESLWSDSTKNLVERASQMNQADYEATKKAQIADGTYEERIRERQDRQGVAALEEAVTNKDWERDRLSNIWNSFASNPKLGEGEARDDAIEAATKILIMLNTNNNETNFKYAAEDLAYYVLGSDVENYILDSLAGYCDPGRIDKIKAALKELHGSSDAAQNLSHDNLTIIDGDKKTSGATQRPPRDDLKVVSGNGTPNITAEGSSHEQPKVTIGDKEAWKKLSGINDDNRLNEFLSNPNAKRQTILNVLMKTPAKQLVERVAGLSIRQIAAELEDSGDRQLDALMGSVDSYIKGLVFGDNKLREKNDRVGPGIDVDAFRDYLAEDRSGDFTDENLAEKVGDLSIGQLLAKIKDKNSLLAQELPKLLGFYLANPASAVHDLIGSEPAKDGVLDPMTTIRMHSIERGHGDEIQYDTLGRAIVSYEHIPFRGDQGSAVRWRKEIELAMADYPENVRTELAKTLDTIANSEAFRKQKLLNRSAWLKNMIAMRQENLERTKRALEDPQFAGDMKQDDIKWSGRSAAGDVAKHEAELALVMAKVRAYDATERHLSKISDATEQKRLLDVIDKLLTQAETPKGRDRIIESLDLALEQAKTEEEVSNLTRRMEQTLATRAAAGNATNNPQPTGNNGDNTPPDTSATLSPAA